MPELFSAEQWERLARELRLSPRQSQVARQVCKGLTTDAIAGRLGLSAHTVRMHLRGLFERLDVQERVGVVVRLVVAEREL